MRWRLRDSTGDYELVERGEELPSDSFLKFCDAGAVRRFVERFPSNLYNRQAMRNLLARFRSSPTSGERSDLVRHVSFGIWSGTVRVARLAPRTRLGHAEMPEEKGRASAPSPKRERRPVELILRLDVDPSNAQYHDDKFILTGSDGYRSEKTIRDDETPGDDYLDLRFTGLYEDQSYSLQVIEEPGEEPRVLFRDVTYSELAGLSNSGGEDAGKAEAGSGPGGPGGMEAE